MSLHNFPSPVKTWSIMSFALVVKLGFSELKFQQVSKSKHQPKKIYVNKYWSKIKFLWLANFSPTLIDDVSWGQSSTSCSWEFAQHTFRERHWSRIALHRTTRWDETWKVSLSFVEVAPEMWKLIRWTWVVKGLAFGKPYKTRKLVEMNSNEALISIGTHYTNNYDHDNNDAVIYSPLLSSSTHFVRLFF